MFYKLALNNVKKSVRDYAVYFLTLTFGICIFYVFNSIDSQRAMLDITKSQYQIMQSLSEMIAFISVFISVILGLLIIYANKFLIKRRKKELGLYMTLGMEKGKISRILILETLIIGVLSLTAGLIAGVFLSHGFSVVTAHLFAVDMKEFTFIFSKQAFIKSIIYFGIIYLVVMVFNTVSISQYKLIDLLNAGRHNEDFKVKRLGLSVVIFAVSILCLSFSYWAIIKNSLMSPDALFYSAFIFCFIGTLLFFYSLSGFMLKIVQSNKRLYFKNLNMFILRQINSRINTAFISMTFISLMLAVSIVALSSGMALSDMFTSQLEQLTPFSASLFQYENKGEEKTKISETLKQDGIDLDSIAKDYIDVPIYNADTIYENLLPSPMETSNPYVYEYAKPKNVEAMAVSDYNRILEAQGIAPVQLAEDQFLVNVTFPEMVTFTEAFLKNQGSVQIFGKRLTPHSLSVLTHILQNTNGKMDMGTLIVSDSVVQAQSPVRYLLNVQYQNNYEKTEDPFMIELEKKYAQKESKPYDSIDTRQEIYDNSKGLSATVTYLTIYIGIVFLITCAAVLALQQLSEASDNVERFALLSKLGAEGAMLSRALFTQIFIYFMVPLSLAIVHSIIGITVISNILAQLGYAGMQISILMTALLFVVVYGGYFTATYLCSRNILRPRKL